MKALKESILAILLALITCSRLVLGDKEAHCTTSGSHITIKLANANLLDLDLKIPANCAGYDLVTIIGNTFGSIHVNSFKEISTRRASLKFNNNKGINNANLRMNADFTKTGIIYYQINSNKKLVLGKDMRFDENADQIRLVNNEITELPSGLFNELRMLKKLHLQRNLLTCIDSDTFGGLEALYDLDISQNRLKDLMSETFLLPQLSALNMSSNNLSKIWSDQFLFRDSHGFGTYPEIDAQNNPLTLLPTCLADLQNFKYTNHSTLTIKGDPDPPGTSPENICKTGLRLYYYYDRCEELKPKTPQETMTITERTVMTTLPESILSTSMRTTKNPDIKKPESYDWAYILFSLLFFLGLPLLGALMWLIWKSVKQRAEVARLEVEMDSANTHHTESFEMTDLVARNAEASAETKQEEPGTSERQGKSMTEKNLNEPKHPGNKETPKKTRKLATRKSEMKAPMAK